ncbi:Chondroitin sulfate synthase 1 [Halotydeus destructor]|nr:Chondroitin sulfate synthase 1 [Halotydeus destructor]
MPRNRVRSCLVNHRSSINFLAGLLVGFVVTCQLRILVYTSHKQHHCHQSHDDLVSGLEALPNVLTGLELAWNASESPYEEQNLIFVGIMTAQKYLDRRSLAIHRTWARTLPGKYAFFSSSSAISMYGLPLVQLPTVDDSYPPQKKSFMMLKFMHDFFIDKYEWFMRADDDVYINSAHLEKFLKSIDSSKPLYIGQAGLGNREEFGALNLEPDQNFCMGGPGVIFSRAALKLLVPNIQYCLKHLYSTHEDVEIGRCVNKFVGISCTWSFEMQSILFHNFSGEIELSSPDLPRIFSTAISMHPIKTSSSQFALHQMYLESVHANTRKEVTNIRRQLRALGENLNLKSSSSVMASNSRTFTPAEILYENSVERERLETWDFVKGSIYSTKNSNPRHQLDGHMKQALDQNICTLVRAFNHNTRKNERVIDFKELHYGYVRRNRKGVSYVLDILMTYRRFKGRRQMLPVRRHAYAIQSFSDPAIREISNQNFDRKVNLIVPLSGRLPVFERFVRNFLEVLESDTKITMAIILFPDESETEVEKVIQIAKRVSTTNSVIRVAQLGGRFSRAAALQRGAALFSKESLLMFLDVDIHFTKEAISRVRRNTKMGSQVYYPIVFSQYNPRFVGSDVSKLEVTEDAGYWRQFGYGIVSLFNSDFQAIGGMNIAIQGWGREDVDLFDRFVKSNLTIFRTTDQGLVHVYHEINCSKSLTSVQHDMCIGTKLNSLGSLNQLATYVRDHNLSYA